MPKLFATGALLFAGGASAKWGAGAAAAVAGSVAGADEKVAGAGAVARAAVASTSARVADAIDDSAAQHSAARKAAVTAGMDRWTPEQGAWLDAHGEPATAFQATAED